VFSVYVVQDPWISSLVFQQPTKDQAVLHIHTHTHYFNTRVIHAILFTQKTTQLHYRTVTVIRIATGFITSYASLCSSGLVVHV